MSDIPYGFQKPVAKTLHDMARAAGQRGGAAGGVPEQRRVAIALPDTDMSPGSISTPTTATIELQEFGPTNAIATTGIDETAYNFSNHLIPSGVPVAALREYVSGKWITIPLRSCGDFIIKTRSGGIPACSGDTPGTATVDFYEISSGTLTIKTSETAYNIDCTAIPGDTYTGAWREAYDGNLIAIVPPVTDLRLDGSNFQYKRGCTWTTWETGTDCPT